MSDNAPSDTDPPGYGDINTFLRVAFVLLSRIGFLLIQVGSIPVENVYRIVFFNVFELGIACVFYIGAGHMIAFGEKTLLGYLGYSTSPLNFAHIDDKIVGLTAVLIGTSQISCFLIGRVHLMASIFTTILYSGFYQPMLAHWIWYEEGWMKKFTFLGSQVSVKDYAGNLVIHLSSSLIGLIGATFLGRRLIKLKDLDERSISREYAALTIVGYILIIIGYTSYNLPSLAYQATKKPDNYIGVIILNMIVALSTGIFMTSILNMCIRRSIFDYWSIVRCIQGGIAAIISIAAGVDIYNHVESAAISVFSSIFFFFFSIIIHNTSLEDNCNIISSHFITSIFGIIACPIIAKKENFEGDEKITHILWQLICLIIVMVTTIIFSWLIFIIFATCKILRNKEDVRNHKRAVAVSRQLPKRGCLQRLFMINRKTDHIVPGDRDRSKYFQEG